MWRLRKHIHEPVAGYGITTLYESARPWLGLLQAYRSLGRRNEFEIIACRLRDEFNLRRIPWDIGLVGGTEAELSPDNYPHILEKVTAGWGKKECGDYLAGLLADKRQGHRAGFPLPVFDDLLMLYGVLETLLREEPASGRASDGEAAARLGEPGNQA